MHLYSWEFHNPCLLQPWGAEAAAVWQHNGVNRTDPLFLLCLSSKPSRLVWSAWLQPRFSPSTTPSLSLCREPTRFFPISIHVRRIETPLKNTISARLPFFCCFLSSWRSQKKEEMLSAVDKLNPIKICWGAGGLAWDTAGTSCLPSGHTSSQPVNQPVS